MSVIAGVVGKVTEQSVVDRILESMKRRGPGDPMCFMDTSCCLLHRKGTLANTDHESKPVQCVLAGECYTIVYHGKLYNKEEIQIELLQAGHKFDADTDAELVLHAYLQWKEKSLIYLNGIFTFAIWHSKEKKLFLARDRIGVKPLFYTMKDGVLWFASEIKSILADPDITAQIDSQGVAQILLLGPGRIPGTGVFKDIRELRSGCYGQYCNGKWSEKQYWKLTDREHTETLEQTAEHARYLLVDAIKRQTDDNLPIGTFLSGGLDSSIISSVCAQICRKEGKMLNTFSVDYENHDKYFKSNKFQPEADRYYIELMRREIGSDHLDVILSAKDLIECMDDATVARDLPGMADVDFSLFAFCRHVREHVPVALSGECADEIFCGYPWYRDPDIRAVDGFPWAQNVGFRAGFIIPEHLKDIEPNSFVMDLYKTTLNNSDILPGTNRIDRRMKELVNLNFEWFMQTLLDRNDRMSMYHNLDVRVPFCDYRIAEYLYGVPWVLKDYANREKGLLRYAMRGILPEQVLYRKKSPYPKTFDPMYLEIVSQELREVICNPSSPILQLVKKDALEKLLTAELSWPWYGQLMKQPQTIAYMLQINRWMLLYNVKIV